MLTSIGWKERSCSVGCPVGVQIEPSVPFCCPTQMSGKPVCLNIGRHILLKDFGFHDLLVGLVRALKSFNTFPSTSGKSHIFLPLVMESLGLDDIVRNHRETREARTPPEVVCLVLSLILSPPAWLNNCVGHYNHRYFFSFCFFMTLGCVYCSYGSWDLFREAYAAIEVSP